MNDISSPTVTSLTLRGVLAVAELAGLTVVWTWAAENPEAYAIKMDAEDKLEAEEGDDTVSDVFASPCKHRERKICVVCMDEDRGCRLQPCMHAALCVDCASQLKVWAPLAVVQPVLFHASSSLGMSFSEAFLGGSLPLACQLCCL